MDSNSTFVRVTNKDIFDKLGTIEEKLKDVEQHVIKTNGFVRLNKWTSRIALTLIILVIAALIRIGVG